MDLQTIGTADHNLSRYYTYDNNGNLTSVEYSQEYGSSAMHYGTEKFSYQNGQVKKISFQATPLNNAESVIWEVTSENAQGIPSTIVSGPLTHTYSYDLQTRPLQVQTLKNGTTLRNMSYAYHPQTGNLLSRTDNTRNLQESFTYDHQNRLTGDGTETYEYDNATGNMTYNSRIGTITYGVGIRNSYQVNLIDPLTRTTDDIHLLTVQQKATYNAMSRPATLEESNQLLKFTYNGRCERNIAEFIQITPPQGVWNDTIKTEVERRYYISDIYERSVTKNENKVILYLGGNAYSAPAAFVQDSLFGAHIVYICRDHLGSITHLSSDKINKEYSYDAWGNLRNPDTHELYQTRVSKDYLYLLRGYTGHEHLGYYGLINMNARLYEPATGRFISPDPYVQMPDYSQNYNRYTYCLNNPLKYTDESGEWFLIDDLVAFVVGGTINLASNIIQGNISGDFWECIGKGAAAFGSGGIAGWGGLHPELGGWAWGGAVVGATNAWLGGANSAGGILLGGAMGIASSGMGALGGNLGGQLGGIIVNGTNISSPALASTITGSLGGFGGGYIGGFAVGAIATGDMSEANDMALSAGLSGAFTGAISGFAGGIKYARDNKISPWTGETKISQSQYSNYVEQNYSIRVGDNPNQIHHAYRHTDQLNLDRNLVEHMVIQNVKTNIHNIPINKPYNGVININGYKIQYTAFKRIDKNIINIGRIHAIK